MNWKKYKNKRYPVSKPERELRKQKRNKKNKRHIVPGFIFIISAYLVWLFGTEFIDLLINNEKIEHTDKNFIISLLALLVALISLYFTAFPPEKESERSIKIKKDFTEQLPKHYVDINCQDINPIEDIARDPTRESLRKKMWDWLFDPSQYRKSYLLLLGDFGTGKTTFCFYMAHEIVTTMLSMEVEVIELGKEDLDLEQKLNETKTKNREKTILFLDAYDEYKKRGPSKEEFQEIMDLTSNYYKVIITSRTHFFVSAEAEPYLTTRYISYFTQEQIKYFLKLSHPFRWRSYWKIIEKYPNFIDISRRIVILNYLNDIDILKSIQSLKQKGAELNNWEIYTQIVDHVLPRENEKGPADFILKHIAIEVMSLWGFHIICCGGPDMLSYEKIQNELLSLVEKQDVEQSELKRFLDKQNSLEELNKRIAEVRTRTFLVRDDKGNYGFSHRSFAEYFAARFIIDALVNKSTKIVGINFDIPQRVIDFITGAIKPRFFRATKISNLSEKQTKTMLKKHDLYDRNYNKKGEGITHIYIPHEISYDKIIMDLATGLMWQQGGSEDVMLFNRAQEYINNMNLKKYAGYSDWRLPTLEEAMSLVEPKKENKDLYIDPVFDNRQRWIWTGDLLKDGDVPITWVVNFDSGDCFSLRRFDNCVRAVRPGQSSTGDLVL